MINEEIQEKDKKSEEKKSAGTTQIKTAFIAALIGGVCVALINICGNIIIKRMDNSEVQRKEAQEVQKELEQKQNEEALEVRDEEWETHAGIEYFKLVIGTANETIHFRIRPYLFCDVTLDTGKVIHCWIGNYYTQEEYRSEDGIVELLEEYKPGEMERRFETMLQNKGYRKIEIYSVLLVEYSVREVSPEYVCYCLKNGKLQIREIEWGSALIHDKDKKSFNAECKTWEWI